MRGFRVQPRFLHFLEDRAFQGSIHFLHTRAHVTHVSDMLCSAGAGKGATSPSAANTRRSRTRKHRCTRSNKTPPRPPARPPTHSGLLRPSGSAAGSHVTRRDFQTEQAGTTGQAAPPRPRLPRTRCLPPPTPPSPPPPPPHLQPHGPPLSAPDSNPRKRRAGCEVMDGPSPV